MTFAKPNKLIAADIKQMLLEKLEHLRGIESGNAESCRKGISAYKKHLEETQREDVKNTCETHIKELSGDADYWDCETKKTSMILEIVNNIKTKEEAISPIAKKVYEDENVILWLTKKGVRK
jgi:hypothetical protein